MAQQEEIDTFDGAKPRFSNRGKKRCSSINPEPSNRTQADGYTPGACPEHSRRIRPGSRMG